MVVINLTKNRTSNEIRPISRQGISAHNRIGRLMVAPAVTVILAVTIYPLLFGLATSFRRFDPRLAQNGEFVGFENYKTVLTDTEFRESLLHTAMIAFPALFLELTLGFGLALLMQGSFPGKSIFLSIFMFPVLTIPVVVGITWRLLWHPIAGPINQILTWITGQQILTNWLFETRTAMPAIIITEVWQWTPFMFLLLLAGLTAIPIEVLEAAVIDGASGWQSFWFVTLPLMKRTIMIALFLRALDVVKIFDIIWVMNEGGPGTATQTITQYIYRKGRYLQLDQVAAASILFLIIILILVNTFQSKVREVE